MSYNLNAGDVRLTMSRVSRSFQMSRPVLVSLGAKNWGRGALTCVVNEAYESRSNVRDTGQEKGVACF